MDYKIETNRIYAEDENGKILAEITFPNNGATYCIDHTFVDESLRGQGIASKLVSMAVYEISKNNGNITATCTYAQKWLDTHKI